MNNKLIVYRRISIILNKTRKLHYQVLKVTITLTLQLEVAFTEY